MNIKLAVPEGAQDTEVAEEEEEFVDNGFLVQRVEGDTEDDVEEDDDADEGDEEAEEEAPSGRPGIDVVLREAEAKLGPEFAEVIRGLQGDFTQNHQLQSQLTDAIAEVENLRDEIVGASSEDEEEEDPLEGVPPEQLERLKAYMDKNGYVKQSDVEAVAAREFSIESNKRGVEQWGESFGKLNEETGEFEPSQESFNKMQEAFSRMDSQEQGEIQFEDLYKVTFHDDLIEKAKEEGRKEERNKRSTGNRKRVKQVVGGTVVSRNAAPRTVKPIYSPKDTQGTPLVKRIGDVVKTVRQTLESSG